MVIHLILSNTTELYWVYGNSGGRNYMKLCLRIQFNGTWISQKPMRPRVAWPRIRSLQWEIVHVNRLQEPPKHRSSGSPRYWTVRRNKAGQNIAIMLAVKRSPQSTPKVVWKFLRRRRNAHFPIRVVPGHVGLRMKKQTICQGKGSHLTCWIWTLLWFWRYAHLQTRN